MELLKENILLRVMMMLTLLEMFQNHPEFSELMFKDVNSIKLVINLPSNQTGIVSLEDVQYKLCIEKGKL